MSSPAPAQIAAIVLILCLSACARPIGDFGRAQDDPLHASLASALQGVRAVSSPAPVFNLTDQEKEMRDRVWRYLVAPEDYDWFGDSIVEINRLGFAGAKFSPPPSDRYYVWLQGTAFASSPVRYSRLSDDIKSDLNTLPMVFASICDVERIDRQREIAARALAGIGAKTQLGAEAQRAENLAVIGWFAHALDARYRSYSYALDHLLVETPHDAAIAVDAELSSLQVFVEAAAEDDYCVPSAGGSGAPAASNRTSRFLRGAVSSGGS